MFTALAASSTSMWPYIVVRNLPGAKADRRCRQARIANSSLFHYRPRLCWCLLGRLASISQYQTYRQRSPVALAACTT